MRFIHHLSSESSCWLNIHTYLGRADYLWIDPQSGALTAYLNRIGEIPSDWLPLNGGKPIATGGGPGAGVILTDLNNDGKADYLFIHSDTGAIDAWFNGGPKSDGTWTWNGPTQIASGVSNANQMTVLFADIDGDGRSDLLVKGAEGSLDLWLNTGDPTSNRITWLPIPNIAAGGRLYLAQQRRGCDSLHQRHWWEPCRLGATQWWTAYRLWSRWLPSWHPVRRHQASTPKCNDSFHSCKLSEVEQLLSYRSCIVSVLDADFELVSGDGRADYIYIHPLDGAMDIYINEVGIDPAFWVSQGQVALGVRFSGPSIHFGALAHSGRAEYIPVV